MNSVADYYETLRIPDSSELGRALQHANRESVEFANRVMASRRAAQYREISRQVQEESWATIRRIYG